MALGVPIHDLTGGFKVWSAEVLGRIDLDKVEASEYAFQIEMTWRAVM